MGGEITCDPWPAFAKREVHMPQSNRRVDPTTVTKTTVEI